eukprot:SAG31_NODE_288_length_18400_cov_55.018851_1_plen_79_part_00
MPTFFFVIVQPNASPGHEQALTQPVKTGYVVKAAAVGTSHSGTILNVGRPLMVYDRWKPAEFSASTVSHGDTSAVGEA